MRNFAILWAIGLVMSSAAYAERPGWFVTGQVGWADYETTQKAPRGFFGDTDDAAFSWAAGLGYDFNRYFGVRGMFERSTDHATTNRCPPGEACTAILIREDTDFTNWSLVGMPRFPVGVRTSLFGTLGLQYWDADGGPELPDGDSFELLFGGGVE